MVDCAGYKYGNVGCEGGSMDGAFEYVHDTPLDTEANYPYYAVEGTCDSP